MNPLPSFGSALGAEDLRRLTGHPGQVAGADLMTLEDGPGRGVRVIRLRSGEVDVDVVVDRALDLAGASVRGVPVSWLSPTGVAGPWLAEPSGYGTFRTFFGGLLTTCGLEHVLGPDTDSAEHFAYPAQPTQAFPLHGRVSATPATLHRYGLEGATLVVEGTVRQAAAFAEHLVLRRRIELDVGGATLRLTDTVTNEGYAPTPHAILYHVNVGWPVLAPNARVQIDAGEPRVCTDAAIGVDWRTVDRPGSSTVEQVWEHTPRTGADGRVRASVVNPDIGDGRGVGVEVAYDPSTLPRLCQWRVMNEGHYVVGLEPGNLRFEGRHAAREAGDLVVLDPGGSVTHRVDIALRHS